MDTSSRHHHQRIRFRRLKFTREGKYFVALCLGIGFAAINTGNNLLFLILGMMLSLIIGSGILSEIALFRLQVERHLPSRIFTNQPFLMGIVLSNTKRRLSSFSIQVEDVIDRQRTTKRCYFLKLTAGKNQQTTYRHTFPHRGRFNLSGFKISTQFPFGLFQKSQFNQAPQEIIVFPSIHPIVSAEIWAAQPGENEASGRINRRGDFYGLREYHTGDDPRSIHWRKSAHLGRLLIRQDEESRRRQVTIFLDNIIRPLERYSVTDLMQRQERAVSQAASLAVHYLRRGYAVELQTYTENISLGMGEGHLNRILHTLALLQFIPEPHSTISVAPRSPACFTISPYDVTPNLAVKAVDGG